MTFAVLFLLLAVGVQAADATPAVVLKPVANMYSRPGEDAGVVSQAIYGANVGIVETREGWARIRTADDYTGWTPLAGLRTGQSYATTGHVAEVQSLFAHIYGEASVTRHAPAITLPFETKLEVIDEPPGNDRQWIEVHLADDKPGWVQRGDIAFDAKPIGIAEMIELSRRFLGLPYTWGGASSYGYDCSGFAQMLYRRRGVLLPRDAQPQAESSGLVPVKREELESGDLLYFGSSEKKITHTGVYIFAGKFINATTHVTPTVRIDDLGEPHWAKLLVAVRRVKR